jgi:hypothetical protein
MTTRPDPLATAGSQFQVAIRPSEASEQRGRPALTPELLAASGARYSRNNEGLEAILSKIDPRNLDKSVDSISRMIDYGHQPIADMVPVAMFIDGISIWLAHRQSRTLPAQPGFDKTSGRAQRRRHPLPSRRRPMTPISQIVALDSTGAFRVMFSQSGCIRIYLLPARHAANGLGRGYSLT